MGDQLVKITDDFYNVRGTLKLLMLNIGTQTSLVRLKSGDFVLLDSYLPPDDIRAEIERLTGAGKAIKAVLNLHPFHTIHVRSVAAWLPHLQLFGTRRHVQKFPDLKWQGVHTEDSEISKIFGDDFDFSVPRGVQFVPEKSNLHFSSVLAFHRASRTLHVDDTLTWSHLPILKGLQLHPSLPRVLERRVGAVDDFSSWLDELVERCRSVDHVCTAHLSPLPPGRSQGVGVDELVVQASQNVRKKLEKHKARYG